MTPPLSEVVTAMAWGTPYSRVTGNPYLTELGKGCRATTRNRCVRCHLLRKL